MAKAKVITKIAQKIDKGYYSETARKIDKNGPSDKKIVRKKKTEIPDEKCNETEP